MEVIVKPDYDQISKLAARMIADVIRNKPRCVLGLATGGTPVGTYKELIRMHEEEGLDFSQASSFNLDEYVGLEHAHDQSYWYFMNDNLFKHVNINLANVHVPDGKALDIESHCRWYDEEIRKWGGLDIQILGIGGNGHIAFNEPGTAIWSRTHWTSLDERTIADNTRFFKSVNDVPRYALTMGIGTILEARKIIMLANKDSKADAIAAAVEGAVTAMVPASTLQFHPDTTVIIDKAAASKLKRTYRTEPAKAPVAKRKR